MGYTVNTDPHDRPRRHWIALWTTPENVCEIFDSYALPLQVYETTQPLMDWINTLWKYVVRSSKSLQSLYSQSCGDHALMYLRHRARVEDMRKFFKLFSRHDYVANDHKVDQMLKRLIEKRSFTRRIVYDLRQTRIKLVNVFLEKNKAFV